MTVISYAQNFEDVMLLRAFKDINDGFYIDVGANDPTNDSVTKAFYDMGWHGINIEPAEQWFVKLTEQRSRDINIQMAAGTERGELTLYEFPDTGLSTVAADIANKHVAEGTFAMVEKKVAVEPLTDICREHLSNTIHFLKIDVEGVEEQVLRGIDFAVMRPWIIVVESTLPRTQIESYASWESILVSADYEFVYFDGLNRFYIAAEHQELKAHFSIPPNCFDEFIMNCSEDSSVHNRTIQEIKHLQATLRGIENSRAWTLLMLMRKTKLSCKYRLSLMNPSRFKSRSFSRPRVIAKIVSKTQQMQANKTHLRAKVVATLSNYPLLYKCARKLKNLPTPLLQQQAAHSFVKHSDTETQEAEEHAPDRGSMLSANAQRIYNKLQTMIAQPKQRKNNCE